MVKKLIIYFLYYFILLICFKLYICFFNYIIGVESSQVLLHRGRMMTFGILDGETSEGN